MNGISTHAELNDTAARFAAVYNAAADSFDAPPLAFWERIGARTAERLELQPGETVLDVGCGAGSSLLPAARAVGPDGKVIGIDVADSLLASARNKADRLGLADRIDLRQMDMAATGFADESFDAVISVFSIFFVDDMEGQIAELWRMLRPGGRLAVTTWGLWMMEPGAAIFWQEVRRRRPDLIPEFRPPGRITTPDKLRQLFLDGGASAPEIAEINDVQRLKTPDDWWTMALGGGLRETIDALTPAEREAVRKANVHRIAISGISAVETNALHAIAVKQG